MKHTIANINRNSIRATVAGVGVLILSGCATEKYSYDNLFDANEQSVQYEDRLSRGLYAVAGIGPSRMEPDTSRAPGWDVNDRVEPAGQVTIGADLSKHLSIEAHSADLGSAGLSPRGRINYHVNGASALVYAGGNRNRYRRQGLTGYGRIGVGVLENSSVGDVSFTRENDTHVLFGAGVEYMTPIGVGLRAEGIAFDTDAQYAQIGLMYRTGRKQEKKKPRLAEIFTEQQQPEIAAARPEPVIPATAVMDSCSGLGGLLEGVVFPTDSAGLTSQSVRVLNQVAATLNECPELNIELSAHTDATGSEDYNDVLAGKRARSVVEYLRATGLSQNRLIVNALGENAPVDTNSTPEGRARNRRVDLIAR